MEFIFGVCTAIVGKLAECTVGRLFHYTSDVDKLRARVQELNAAKQDVQGRVDEATRSGEEIYEHVQNWLRSAGGISQRAEDFLNNNRDRANISCFNVRIPNLVSRRQLRRDARQMADDVDREIQAGRFVRVSSRPALHIGIASRGDYKDFGSRKTILEDIIKALQDRYCTRIGVYGMGGIGKTMLAKEVARQAVEAKLFAEVAMTTVSQTPDSIRMQKEIAEKIGANFEGVETLCARADRVQRRLKEQKSILIILDDIWEELDLIEIGIQSENGGCKILITSRSQEVLGYMKTEKNFCVEDLPADEAMNLFQTIVGDIVEQSDFKKLAIDVVKECGGLPLAIRTVAYALKNYRDSRVWKDALAQLQNSAPTSIGGMLKNVYPSIRLSYDCLESYEEKSLLLLCSLYGEDADISIEELMTCSMGWGLFQGIHTLADARRRMTSLVLGLKARCLLLEGEDCDRVKMHDVIRDVALWIASEERGMRSVTLKNKEDCLNLNKKKIKDSKVLSILLHSDFNQLPERLECPQLELLLAIGSLFRKDMPIPQHFLEECKDHVKSLVLQGANLVPVPPSFHSLQNLQTLCLRGCALEDVDFIGDLKNLIILDLSRSTIDRLPIKLGQLKHLQQLNLEGCRNLKLIEPNVISSLVQLEELYLPHEFDKWEVGEVIVSSRSNANLAELMNLRQLNSLSLRVPDAKTFPKDFMFSENLERYKIYIDDQLLAYFWDIKFPERISITRSLFLKHLERSQLQELGLESLMKRSEGLSLDGLIGVENVVYDLDNEGFCDLRRLRFTNNEGVQYIANCVDQNSSAFPMLESLILENLTKLKRICHGKLPEDSFKNLREVRVSGCHKLKNLFPLSIVKRLHSIKVSNCEMMEEIVGHEREDVSDGALQHNMVEFPELRSLTLKHLPKLVQFICWSEWEAACVSSFPLFSEKVALPSLEYLTLNELGVKKLWPDQLPSTSYLQNLSSLYVHYCHNLEYLSSLAVAKSCLIKLKELQVFRCDVLEEVLQREDGSLERISLPQLKSLTLSLLPKLKRFCKRPDEMRTLVTSSTSTELAADGSEFGTKEPLFNEIVALLSLEYLSLWGLGVKKLWPDQLPSTSYLQNLSSLVVNDCNNLEYLSSLAVAKSCLIKLKELQVFRCDVLEEVLQREDGSLERISLPQLKCLKLSYLPKLKRFCKRPDEMRTLVTSSTSTELAALGSEFGTKEPLFNEMLEFPVLEELDLSDLDVVESLWQLRTTSHTDSLTSLNVQECNNLKYLFSFAVAERLVKLKKLQVEDCELMEEIVVSSGGSSGKILIFPKLESLQLSNLSALTKFFEGDCIEFKSLSSLTIGGCLELKTLVSCSMPIQVSVASEEVNHQAISKRPLLDEKVIFSKLEYLNTDQVETINDILGMGQSSSAVLRFNQLKGLQVNLRIQDKPIAFSIFKLLHRCSNLKNLELNGSFVDVMCEDQQHEIGTAQEYDGKLITHLRTLKLSHVPKLRHLLKEPENAQSTGGALQPFKTLFVSFQNLTHLSVSFCHRLTYLLASSTAKSLVQLKDMRITNCNRMTDIIGDHRACRITECEHDEDQVFFFPQLEILVLHNLPNLGSFYSGNNLIRFPKLKTLYVSRCPEMRSFSCGIIRTFLLDPIIAEIGDEHYIEYDWIRPQAVREYWDDDVNTTVRKLWEDDSNLALHRLFAETDVHDSGEGITSPDSNPTESTSEDHESNLDEV